MIHAIMLQEHQDKDRPNEYRVSVAGSLAFCRLARKIPDALDTWWKSDYSSCVRIEDHDLEGLKGAIFQLVEIGEGGGEGRRGRRWPVAAVVGGTFLVGMVVGARFNKQVLLRGDEQ